MPTAGSTPTLFTRAQVAAHNREGDAWIVVDNHVLDVSAFVKLHPGCRQILQRVAGKDASKEFAVFHDAGPTLRKYLPRLKVGELVPAEFDGDRGPRAFQALLPDAFGSFVPSAEPTWYSWTKSPYYKETHIQFRRYVRETLDTHLGSTLDGWVDDKEPPRDVALALGKAGIIACLIGSPFPAEYVDPGTPLPRDFDAFHELIVIDEVARAGGLRTCSLRSQTARPFAFRPSTRLARKSSSVSCCPTCSWGASLPRWQ